MKTYAYQVSEVVVINVISVFYHRLNNIVNLHVWNLDHDYQQTINSAYTNENTIVYNIS